MCQLTVSRASAATPMSFNAATREFCTARGAAVFEMYAVTAGATTTDGLHRALRANVELAQLLLNQLSQGEGWARAVDALGDGFL